MGYANQRSAASDGRSILAIAAHPTLQLFARTQLRAPQMPAVQTALREDSLQTAAEAHSPPAAALTMRRRRPGLAAEAAARGGGRVVHIPVTTTAIGGGWRTSCWCVETTCTPAVNSRNCSNPPAERGGSAADVLCKVVGWQGEEGPARRLAAPYAASERISRVDRRMSSWTALTSAGTDALVAPQRLLAAKDLADEVAELDGAHVELRGLEAVETTVDARLGRGRIENKRPHLTGRLAGELPRNAHQSGRVKGQLRCGFDAQTLLRRRRPRSTQYLSGECEGVATTRRLSARCRMRRHANASSAGRLQRLLLLR